MSAAAMIAAARLRPLLTAAGAVAGLLGASTTTRYESRSDTCRFRQLFPPLQLREQGCDFKKLLSGRVMWPPVERYVRCMDAPVAAAPRPPPGAHAAPIAPDNAPESPGREAKRQKTDWAQWELSPMRRLRQEGDGIEIEVEVQEEQRCFRDKVIEDVRSLADAHPGWLDYSREIRGAVILLNFADDAANIDWQSNLFKTRILIGILKDEMRAHESGGYARQGNVWKPTGEGFG